MIHINLQKINESSVRDLMIFTEELIAQNPRCLEINEVLDEAQASFNEGDFEAAKIKTQDALNSCRDAISQVSIPRADPLVFRIGLYIIILVSVVGVIFLIGLVYYFWKRRRLQKIVEVKKSENI